jgi:hypothetical protein
MLAPLLIALMLSLSSLGCAETPQSPDKQPDSAGTRPAKAHSPGAGNPEAESELGGWRELATESEEIRRIFTWARARIAERHPEVRLDPPARAERQVVAGYKYRLHCPYLRADGSKPRAEARIVVWEKPDGSLELLSVAFSGE